MDCPARSPVSEIPCAAAAPAFAGAGCAGRSEARLVEEERSRGFAPPLESLRLDELDHARLALYAARMNLDVGILRPGH